MAGPSTRWIAVLVLLFLMQSMATCNVVAEPEGTGGKRDLSEGRFQDKSRKDCENDVKTVFRISGISVSGGREWLTGAVLLGKVVEGAALEAVGLSSVPCTIDEVRVGDERRSASRGEECRIFLRPGESILSLGGVKSFMALVSPGSVRSGKVFRAKLTWTSQMTDPYADSPIHVPLLQSVTEDTDVELMFAEIEVHAILKKPAESLPVDVIEEWEFVLEKPLPLIPGYPFHVFIEGASAASGWILQAVE